MDNIEFLEDLKKIEKTLIDFEKKYLKREYKSNLFHESFSVYVSIMDIIETGCYTTKLLSLRRKKIIDKDKMVKLYNMINNLDKDVVIMGKGVIDGMIPVKKIKL